MSAKTGEWIPLWYPERLFLRILVSLSWQLIPHRPAAALQHLAVTWCLCHRSPLLLCRRMSIIRCRIPWSQFHRSVGVMLCLPQLPILRCQYPNSRQCCKKQDTQGCSDACSDLCDPAAVGDSCGHSSLRSRGGDCHGCCHCRGIGSSGLCLIFEVW